MKFVIRIFLLFLVASSNLCLAENNGDYRQKLLFQAAQQNGYELPERINNSFDPQKSALGKLFFETEVLSFNSNTSCSSCHLDKFSSADGLPIARMTWRWF